MTVGSWYLPGPSRLPGVEVIGPSVARLYDHYLGGKNHYSVDRMAAERIRTVFPDLVDAAWANRGFHGRAAGWMARQGIRQFVDAGCGLPTTADTYTAVHRFADPARVAYVDHDPLVIAHARALLMRPGSTSVVTADIRDPESVIAGLRLDGLINLAEPIGLLVTAVMHFVADEDDPWGCVARLVAALAPRSFLALSHATADSLTPAAAQTITDVYADATERLYLRPRAEVARFFDGLTLVPPYTGAVPGLVHAGLWGCEDPELADSEGARAVYCAVARR